jgi:hypothetical protein
MENELEPVEEQQSLVQECAKLQPTTERAAAEEFFEGEAEWPEY